MRRIGEAVLLGALGAVVCALFFWIYFMVLAAVDGGNVGEAAFYGIIFAFGASLVGAVVGVMVALLRANVFGGAALGLLGAALFVLLWTLLGTGDGGLGPSLTRSIPFAIYYSLPAILTGLLVASVRVRRERRRDRLAVVDAG